VFYWLFTDGRELLGSLLVPLSCLTLLLPLLASAVLGAGIRRSSEGLAARGWKRGLTLLTHFIALLGVTAVVLHLLG